MSVKNIVVIRKEEDGVYRGYYQKYDEWRKYLYDYTADFVQAQSGSVYLFEENNLIFEAKDMDEALDKYHKWLEKMQEKGYRNHGYTFECVRPSPMVEEVVIDIVEEST